VRLRQQDEAAIVRWVDSGAVPAGCNRESPTPATGCAFTGRSSRWSRLRPPTCKRSMRRAGPPSPTRALPCGSDLAAPPPLSPLQAPRSGPGDAKRSGATSVAGGPPRKRALRHAALGRQRSRAGRRSVAVLWAAATLTVGRSAGRARLGGSPPGTAFHAPRNARRGA
jgi:hypothetical protein